MRRLLLTTAALALLAGGWTNTSFAASELKAVTVDTAVAEINEADKPVLVLQTPEKCDTCAQSEALLANHAGKHADLKIVKLVGILPEVQAPTLWESVRGEETWKRSPLPPLSEDNIDSFLDERAAIGAKEMVLIDRKSFLEAQQAAILAPFDQQMAALEAEEKIATQADDAKYADLQKRIDAVRKGFNDQIRAVKKQADATDAIFDREVAALQAQAKQKGISNTDEILSVRTKAGAVWKSNYNRMRQLRLQADAAALPLETEMYAVSAHEHTVLVPLIAKEEEIATARGAAIRDVLAQSQTVREQLEALLAADYPKESGSTE
jgi:hypothetical protein